MPTYETMTRFNHDLRHLTPQQRHRFHQVVTHAFVPDLRTGRFRASLRIKIIQNAPGRTDHPACRSVRSVATAPAGCPLFGLVSCSGRQSSSSGPVTVDCWEYLKWQWVILRAPSVVRGSHVFERGGLVALDETELSEAIKAVRAGLTAAQQDGADTGIRFKVKEIVLDLSIEIRKAESAGGGVKAFVVSGEARGERSHGSTHRVTVTMGVDGPVRIGDQGETAGRPGGPAFR